MSRLLDNLRQKEENYILPFYWQHGENREELLEGLKAIYNSGIHAVCLESRPHPDFLGEKWWMDVEFLMEEAKRLDMRVWILDDAHFPSGYCNGMITRASDGKYSPYAKQYLDYYAIDVHGPVTRGKFLIRLKEQDELEGVVAAKRDKDDVHKLTQLIDITQKVKGKQVSFSVPEGLWTIFVITRTWHGDGRAGYINPIDKEAVSYFIQTVYEPHYAHFKEEFGKTFAGFFSDEPEIGNTVGKDGFQTGIGNPTMTLPWSRELEEAMDASWGETKNEKIVALWNQVDGISPVARYEYMNWVTSLYGTHFCGQIGDWCRKRGVEYIGHVIEDQGMHARLGMGTGHFFKALYGEDMSGIDVVLQQIRPDLNDVFFRHIGGKNSYDGTFFHYGLAQMGVSLGHLDPKKKGRTMCEIYGAYGWSEGVSFMKWLTDFMLVRGVNWFVPHAFTMKDFPDPDCPPHFYARGNNPQYPYFKNLMQYMNRMCHLFNGGIPVPQVALLYTAPAQWMAQSDGFEVVGKELYTHQINYDVLPMELLETGKPQDGCLKVGNIAYKALIIPHMPYMPVQWVRRLEDLCNSGITIIYIEEKPKEVQVLENDMFWEQAKEKMNDAENMHQIVGKESVTVSLKELCDYLWKNACYEIRTLEAAPSLAYYHYSHSHNNSSKYDYKGEDFYMFFNESKIEAVDTWIQVPFNGQYNIYDAFHNRSWRVTNINGDETHNMLLHLEPGETRLICLESDETNKNMQEFLSNGLDIDTKQFTRSVELTGPWTIAKKKYNESTYQPVAVQKLIDITDEVEFQEFSGIIKYELDFAWNCSAVPAEITELLFDFGEVYETLEVWLNSEKLDICITAPYRIFVPTNLLVNYNHLTIYVTNTLVHAMRDQFSMTMPLDPSGLLGPVKIFF